MFFNLRPSNDVASFPIVVAMHRTEWKGRRKLHTRNSYATADAYTVVLSVSQSSSSKEVSKWKER